MANAEIRRIVANPDSVTRISLANLGEEDVRVVNEILGTNVDLSSPAEFVEARKNRERAWGREFAAARAQRIESGELIELKPES